MLRTVFLNDRQIKALSILARCKIEELNLVNENPDLITLYSDAVKQLEKAQ